MFILDNWMRFQDVLNATTVKYGRNVDEISVMAVTKTRTIEEVRALREAGLQIFGENRVNEALTKFADLDSKYYPLYLIGHIQSNKVALIGSRVAGVHSVDSLKLASRLSNLRKNNPLEILLQVNTSGEKSKSGICDRGEFVALAAAVQELPYLKLCGVMTMAPFVNDERTVRACFAACREWGGDIEAKLDVPIVLSMGMSSDFRWAIAEGSTQLRIGTMLFGSSI